MTLRSMTGFGRAHLNGLTCELRSVNHRGLDLRFRLPVGWQCLEPALQKSLRGFAVRGSITVSLAQDSAGDQSSDHAWVDVRAAQWQSVASHLGRDEPPPMTWLLAGQSERGTAPPEPAVALAVLEAAAVVWNAERSREGAYLGKQLKALVAQMAGELALIAEQEPIALARQTERLRRRMSELIDEHAVDEGRLLQEVALLSERRDISEERVRLAAHLDAIALAIEGEKAVGRRLGFLAQELLREVNTIGSKAQDLTISERVVELKTCIEQLREQVLNLE